MNNHRYFWRKKTVLYETRQAIQNLLEQIQSKVEIIDDANVLRQVLTLEIQALAAIDSLYTATNSGSINSFPTVEKFPPKNEVQLSFKQTTRSAGRKIEGQATKV